MAGAAGLDVILDNEHRDVLDRAIRNVLYKDIWERALSRGAFDYCVLLDLDHLEHPLG